MRSLRSCPQGVPGALLRLAVAILIATAQAPQKAVAQVPFRITRPENGATVRETVRIQVPRAALPADGYLSYTIDDRFQVALAIPPIPAGGNTQRSDQMEWNANTVTFLWDTKAIDQNPGSGQEARVVRDGPHTIEVAAVDRGGKRVGVGQVSVNVANQTITSPSEGVPLSYKFQVGDAAVYTQHTEVQYLGGQQATTTGPNRGGSRFGSRAVSRGARGGFSGGYPGAGPEGSPGELGAPSPSGYPGEGSPGGAYPGGAYPGAAGSTGPFTPTIQTVDARYVRTTEDNLGGGRYFVRDKVTKGTIIAGTNGARLEDVYALKSRYRTVTSTGKVISSGTLSASKPGAYVALPMVDLGGGRRRVGQKWQTRVPIKLEWATLDAPPLVNATNTLESLEWQDGYQTARIRQTYNGKATIPIHGGAGRMENANVEMERTIWFGYKPGRIIRMETTVTVDGEGPSDVVQAMVSSSGAGGVGAGGMGAEGSESPGLPGLSGGPEAVPDQLPGAIGGGSPFAEGAPGSFGAVPQQQEAAKVPARFKSTTAVSLVSGAKE